MKIEHYAKEMENEWKKGTHTDRAGNTHNISEMSDKHLINTINYFGGLDTNPLEQELRRRLIQTKGSGLKRNLQPFSARIQVCGCGHFDAFMGDGHVCGNYIERRMGEYDLENY